MPRTGPRRAALVVLGLSLAIGCTQPPPDVTSTPASPTPAQAASATAPPSLRPSRQCPGVCRGGPRSVGRFRTSLAPEASGIAAGVRNPDLLYIVDDGPGTAQLLVVRAKDAAVEGKLAIAGLEGRDTEDLAVGPCEASGPASCIYIADIGDNLETRDSVRVVRVVEPDLSSGIPQEPIPAETATWRYPDRPHDAEALLAGDDGSL